MKKIFYRVGNVKTQQGLWYDFKGNFTGLIHKDFNFCSNRNLLMPYDENIVGWLSATETLEELFGWFTKKDIKRLEPYGFTISEYETSEYKSHGNHWLIKQDGSVLIRNISIHDVV